MFPHGEEVEISEGLGLSVRKESLAVSITYANYHFSHFKNFGRPETVQNKNQWGLLLKLSWFKIRIDSGRLC